MISTPNLRHLRVSGIRRCSQCKHDTFTLSFNARYRSAGYQSQLLKFTIGEEGF
jgi:hypothetical protein